MLPRQQIQILCVDDEAGVTQMLSMVLKAAGYDVETAANGFVALQRISRELGRFRMVMTDIRMPLLDGFGLIADARTAGYAGPFVVLAGMLSPDDRQRLRELRVSRVLEKPSRPVEIVDAVREALAAH